MSGLIRQNIGDLEKALDNQFLDVYISFDGSNELSDGFDVTCRNRIYTFRFEDDRLYLELPAAWGKEFPVEERAVTLDRNPKISVAYHIPVNVRPNLLCRTIDQFEACSRDVEKKFVEWWIRGCGTDVRDPINSYVWIVEEMSLEWQSRISRSGQLVNTLIQEYVEQYVVPQCLTHARSCFEENYGTQCVMTRDEVFNVWRPILDWMRQYIKTCLYGDSYKPISATGTTRAGDDWLAPMPVLIPFGASDYDKRIHAMWSKSVVQTMDSVMLYGTLYGTLPFEDSESVIDKLHTNYETASGKLK